MKAKPIEGWIPADDNVTLDIVATDDGGIEIHYAGELLAGADGANLMEAIAKIYTPTPEVKGAYPVVMYFRTAREQREFIAAVLEVKPNLTAKAL